MCDGLPLLQRQVIHHTLSFTTLAVHDTLNSLHVCGVSSNRVAEPLEWDLLCGKTSHLLTSVMAQLLSTLQKLAPPQQV
jgi:hypothetical protein